MIHQGSLLFIGGFHKKRFFHSFKGGCLNYPLVLIVGPGYLGPRLDLGISRVFVLVSGSDSSLP